METRAHRLPSDSSSAPAAAAYPRWILLNEIFFGGRGDPDTMTVAQARTAKGRPISISFVLAAPPAVSRVHLDSPGMPQLNGENVRSYAIAAHMDSVLLKIENNGSTSWDDDYDRNMSDYFIYFAGDAATDPSRPLSLALLPPCNVTEYMDVDGTALLRRGQDEVLVAGLRSWLKKGDGSQPLVAELFLLRSHDWEWELKRLPVIHKEGKREEVSRWHTETVIPVGDRLLFWVDYLRGIIYSDMWQETPELRYLSLPVEPDLCTSLSDRDDGAFYRSLCPTDGGRALRFVEVFPRCCCGCPVARTDCALSRHAFTITTWALRMDDMTTWDKVGVVDCQELWFLPGYHGVVPRIRPTYPTVNLHDPDLLCFVVHKTTYHKGVDGDLGSRLIEVDTRSMELRSVCYYDPKLYFFNHYVASEVSKYFDASSRCRAPARRIDADLEAPARQLNSTLPKVVSPEEMSAMLREIPNLAPDDMMEVYGILACDESQFKFRSLVALPIDMRKDYCLLIRKLAFFDAKAGVGNFVC